MKWQLHRGWTIDGLFQGVTLRKRADALRRRTGALLASGKAAGQSMRAALSAGLLSCLDGPTDAAVANEVGRPAKPLQAEVVLQPTGLEIVPGACFRLKSTDEDLSLMRSGALRLHELEPPLPPDTLSLLGRQWYRALMSDKVEYLWAPTGHLVALVRTNACSPEEERKQHEQQVRQNKLASPQGKGGGKKRGAAAGKPAAPKERVEYAIALKGWSERLDLDLVLKVTRLLTEAIATRDSQRKMLKAMQQAEER